MRRGFSWVPRWRNKTTAKTTAKSGCRPSDKLATMFYSSSTQIAAMRVTSYRRGSLTGRSEDYGTRSPNNGKHPAAKAADQPCQIDTTTEADIRRHMREDDQHETILADFAPVVPPQLLRKRLCMTQSEFARALGIPLATLRNWEQGRVLPDPAARSLLTIVAKNPNAALKALAT
jgi:putative transcriptional regulator